MKKLCKAPAKKLCKAPAKKLHNDWEEEWVGMPEYNNVQRPLPLITVTFKFRNQEDFEVFNNSLKKNLYNDEKVFDGRQTKTVKSAWYPLNEKASKYKYV